MMFWQIGLGYLLLGKRLAPIQVLLSNNLTNTPTSVCMNCQSVIRTAVLVISKQQKLLLSTAVRLLVCIG